MNLQQAPLPKSYANGFGRRRGGDRDVGAKLENKLQSGKSNPERIPNSAGGKVGGPSHDRLVYLATCLIGHTVEVHVKNGSIFTGIFHATDAERDFGIVLMMARLIKDGTPQGEKAFAEFVSKAPSKTLVIPAKELVQVIAKDVAVTKDGLASELRHEKLQEIMTDSAISQSRHVEMERVLEPWVPDEDGPQHPELENIFDGHGNRNWNQFETNELLFGVKSTFNEELYTTKLEKGPQMRELEKEAMRISREIEGEDTQDLHLAEERGLHPPDNFDIDEETRFSSVYRGRGVDDSGYEEDEERVLDSRNIETFGGSSASVSNRPTDFTSLKCSERVVPSSSSLMDETPSSQSTSVVDINLSGSNDLARQLVSEVPFRSSSNSESRIQDNLPDDFGGSSDPKDSVENQLLTKDPNLSIPMDSQSLLIDKTNSCNKVELSANTTTSAVVHASSKDGEKLSLNEVSEDSASRKVPGEVQLVNSRGQEGSSTSSNSDHIGAAAASASSRPGLSPSSSVGSLSSEKSTLNPHAKEFKLNPNAKSFTPSKTTFRPRSPVSDGSFYYPPNVSPVMHMHGMPVDFGIGPSFAAHQPLIFNHAVAPMQSPQAYIHPNGPHQYGQQQMFLGQSRQVVYMPSYQPEMPYKGRN
ncbi:hypothetical protein SLA2020_232420 [Shorea laevis]